MLDISKQAYIYVIIFVITSVINAFLSIGVYGLSGPFRYLLGFVIASPFVVLYIYHVDCLTTGGCNTWSWIYVAIACFGLILTTLMSTLIVFFKNDLPDVNEQNQQKLIPSPYNL